MTGTSSGEDGIYFKLLGQLEVVEDSLKKTKKIIEELGVVPITFDTSKAKIPGTDTDTAQRDRTTGDQDRRAEQQKKIQQNLNRIADVGVGFVQKTFGLVEQLYAQLKKSSPLLQAIEQLFNLAWTLFFMPIGNKLGEMLIPAVIQLMDSVMEIWDAFEGMSLGEMLEYAITRGAEMLGNFIIDIGETLAGQSGLVGAIGSMLMTMGDFIKNHGAQLITLITKLMEFVLRHLKEIIATIVAFKVASMTMQVMQIYATYAASANIVDFVSGGVTGNLKATGMALGAAAAAGLIGGGVAYGLMSFAEGGHVDAAPGGHLAIVGEGGEGEWIIPDSKMSQIGGNTYNITIQSYSTEELTSKVQSIVSGQISASRLRSGF